MFHLRLLGTPTLQTSDGAPLTGRAAQRHRLALLSLLALAGPRGSNREPLMAILWPESDLERARNLLKVSVYALRQALGQDAVVSDGDALRLNPERVESDVSAFEAAVNLGDHARAVALYGGPFLDGFFLKHAPTFERWVDVERARLARDHSSSLEALAEGAEGRGDLPGAVKRWEAAAAQSPYDSRVALRLLQALEAWGNPAGALHNAATHERVLREELGIAPAPEVTSFVERLRSQLREGSRPAPPFRLHTFGRLELSGPHGFITAEEGDDGLALVLLAVLAAAGAQGMARDALLLAFWPDDSWRGANERLDRALQQVRTSVHRSAIVGTDPLRLDPDVITSDVADFELAWERGSTEEALAHYRGPFLDGFHPQDSSDLEQWAESHRRRLAYVRESALERLTRGQQQGTSLPSTASVGRGPGRSRWARVLAYGLVAVGIGVVAFFATRSQSANETSEATILAGGPPSPPPGSRLARETTTSSAARDLFDQGMTPARFRNNSVARASLDFFRQAVQLDPSFAGARAHLALSFVRIAPADNPTMSRVERLDSAEHHALMAVRLDDSLAEAHGILGCVRFNAYEFSGAQESLTRALALDPSYAFAHQCMVHLLVFEGRFGEALAEALRGRTNDPASSDMTMEVARGHLVNGDCDRARDWLGRLANVRPPLLWWRTIASECLAQMGRWDEAIAIVREGVPAGELQVLGGLGRVLGEAARLAPAEDPALLGVRMAWEQEARAILETLLEGASRGDVTAYSVATVYAGLGEVDLAFEWLEKAFQERSLIFEIMHPRYESLQRDPRFAALRARLGLQSR